MRYSWILLILLFGCRPEPIPLEVEQAESELVVSTQIIPDRGMIMILTRSFSALDDGTQGNFEQEDLQSYLVSGATVAVEYDEQEYVLQELNAGIYGSIEILQEEGKDYKLKITDPEEGNVASSNSQVLSAVPISFGNAYMDRQETTSIWLRLFINFNDPVGKNYYMFNAYVNPRLPDVQSFLSGDWNFEGGEDIGGSTGGTPNTDLGGLSNLFSDFSGTWIFTDEGMDGQYTEKEFIIYNIAAEENDVVLYTLSNISEEYYLYLQARERAAAAIPFITEPVSLPSNINGGYGFFAMHYPVPYVVVLR